MNFVQNWFRIDTKLMQNFMQKHKTVAQANPGTEEKNFVASGRLPSPLIQLVKD